jgi:ABC-type lipoprotein export system ATPase subunit
MSTADPALQISNLRFRYSGGSGTAADRWTVDTTALTLPRGEQLLLTGGSGTGKSTLLHLIAGLLDPSEGEVRVAGRAIHRLRGAARDRFRGRHVGMIFQTFNLLHGFSALENVMAALMFSDIPAREHRSRALGALEQLGIDRVDAPPAELSIGQQQRVAVARAVVCEPALVLADEPTASLDPENAAGAMDLIQSTCRARGAALLCVSHDPSMTERFERRESLKALRSDAGGTVGAVAASAAVAGGAR